MSNWKDTTNFDRLPVWDYKKETVIEGVMTEKRLDVSSRKLCFYEIEVGKDKKYSILGSTLINKGLRELPVGTLVRIEYLGEGQTSEGVKFHNFKVQYDEDTLPVEE